LALPLTGGLPRADHSGRAQGVGRAARHHVLRGLAVRRRPPPLGLCLRAGRRRIGVNQYTFSTLLQTIADTPAACSNKCSNICSPPRRFPCYALRRGCYSSQPPHPVTSSNL